MSEKKIIYLLLGIATAGILFLGAYSFGAASQDGFQLISMYEYSAISSAPTDSTVSLPETTVSVSEGSEDGDGTQEISSAPPPEVSDAPISTPMESSAVSIAEEAPAVVPEISDEPVVEVAKISLNTATLEELCTVPHIGEAIAGRILEYRTAVGGFSIVDELLNISGIGQKTLEEIKPYFILE